MNDQLTKFETAKLAKEKGFNIRVPQFYHNAGQDLSRDWNWENWNGYKSCASAPTQPLLQKWLREIHHIHIEVHNYNKGDWQSEADTYYEVVFGMNGKGWTTTSHFKVYEDALELGLLEGLKLI